jgi:hypothetical protein
MTEFVDKYSSNPQNTLSQEEREEGKYPRVK